MANFTMLLKDVLVANGGDYGFIDGHMRITKPEGIGLGHYPIYDESHRDELNGMIFAEYMNREIAHETDSLFIARVMNHMNLEMPRFNQLYESLKLKIDPLNTLSMTTTSERDGTHSESSSGDSTTSNESGSEARAVSSDTPQGRLSGNADYASSLADSHSKTKNDVEAKQTGKASGESSDRAKTVQEGYSGHAVELLNRYRESLISVDAMVVASLERYFAILLDTPNTFTTKNTGSIYYGY